MSNLNMFKSLNEAMSQEIEERQTKYKKLKEESQISKIKSRVKEIQDEENEVVYDTDADKEIRAYFNHEFDLPELHDRLEKLFGNKKQAVEYFANNEMRVKNSMTKKLNKNQNSNHRDRVLKVNRNDLKESEDTSTKMKNLRLMDTAIRHLNDEDFIGIWLMNGVPDGATEDDIFDIAISIDKDVDYNSMLKLFKKLLNRATVESKAESEDTFYKCPEDAFEFAKQFEPDATNSAGYTVIEDSEDLENKKVLNEDNTDLFSKIKSGDTVYVRNQDNLALSISYADNYPNPEDYDEGYTQGWERGNDEEFDKAQDEAYAQAKEAAENGDVWVINEIDESTLEPTGDIYGYVYGDNELQNVLKQYREVKVRKSLEESFAIVDKESQTVIGKANTIEDAKKLIDKASDENEANGMVSIKDKVDIVNVKDLSDDISDDPTQYTLKESCETLNEIASDTNSFYVGDPCYVLGDEIYYGVWDEKYNFNDGTIKVDDKNAFQVYGTAYGDGTYEDNNGNLYPVDSGTIALVPVGLIAKTEGIKNGAVFKGTNGNISCQEGVFTVYIDGKVEAIIDTKYEDEDDEDSWDYDYNESANVLKENCGKKLDEEEVIDQFNGYTLTKVSPSTSKGYSIYKIKNDETGKEQTVGLEDTKAKSFFRDDTKHAWKNDLKEDETILVNATQTEPDYSITDVTELELSSDGDVQSPDIDALLTMIQESINEKYGNDTINIHIHSSNLIENGSFALVDIKTNEILKEFESINSKDKAVGKSLILEHKQNNLYEFRVNNIAGTTKYIKRTKAPAKAIMEWLEAEFLSEAKKEKELEIIEARTNDLKNAIEYYLSIHTELQIAVSNLQELSKVCKDEESKQVIQNKMYGIAAEFPASIEVKQEENKVEFKVDNSTSLKFTSLDEIVEILFSKSWIRKAEEPKSDTLKESYQQFNIGEIEVVFNPDTYECLYSIGADDTHDKKMNLKKIPSVDTPYNTETIIKNYIESQYGPIPEEVETDAESLDNEPTETLPMNVDTDINVDDTEVVEEDDEVDVGIEPEDASAEPTESQEPTAETGTAKFQKIKPNSGVSLEDVRNNTRDGVVQSDSSYIVVEEREMSDEDFNKFTDDLSETNDIFTGITPLDRKNYAFNVVKITNSNSNYCILVDPVGYNYARYIAVQDNV